MNSTEIFADFLLSKQMESASQMTAQDLFDSDLFQQLFAAPANDDKETV